jgi:hypothetical protein
MSIRPRDVPVAKVARAGQRMAPGGRRWSESPIPRVAVRRVRARQAPIVLPTALGIITRQTGVALTRGAATLEALGGVRPYTGDMLATVMVTEGQATVPDRWTLLYSHTFTDFRVYVAGLNAADEDLDYDGATWSMDWSGVGGLQEATLLTARLTTLDADNPTSGLAWDVKAQANDGSASGTWATATDAAWVHSVPVMVNEDCDWTSAYTTNSLGASHVRLTYADTNAYVGWARCGTYSLRATASAYQVGALDGDGVVWAPDNAYTHSTAGFTGTPSNASILLGTKPA